MAKKSPPKKDNSGLQSVPKPQQPVRITDSDAARLVSLIRQEMRSVTQSWSGPIPPPAALREIPGGADRILKMAEKQSEHRISMETVVVNQEVKRSNHGLICGTIVTMWFGCVGVYALSVGQPWAAAVICGVPTVGLVSVFVIGAQSRKEERTEKAKIQQGKEPVEKSD